MNQRFRPNYTDKNSTQTLRQGLQEYYTVNPNLTNPQELPPEFSKILSAHDVSHIIFGCDTGMYDELKLLPLIWWTSDYKFRDHLRTLQDSTIGPAIRIMHDDLIKQHGWIGLYGSIFWVLPRLIPELYKIWLKTHKRQHFVPFVNFEPLLDRSLRSIRQEYDLFPLIP